MRIIPPTPRIHNYADGYATLQAAYDALPSTGGVIVVTPGRRYDVGAGLALTRSKPVELFAMGRPARGNPLASGTAEAYTGPEAVIYSSTGASALVQMDDPASSANGYGFAFRNIVFELTSADTHYAIRAVCVCSAIVENCRFWASHNAPADAIGIYAYVDGTYGDDASWWRIRDNTVSRMALCQFGDNTGSDNANQNVIEGNAGIGLGAATAGTKPFIALYDNHRSVVRDNNVEKYEVGIYMESCFGCIESGNGGEQTKYFLRVKGGNNNLFQPLGVSIAAAISGSVLVDVDGPTNCVFVLPSVAIYTNFATAVTVTSGSLSDNQWVTSETTRIRSDLVHTGTKVGFYGVTPATRPVALTAANASAVNSGDATTDTVIGNMRTRIGELEARLQSLGLIT